MIYNYIVPIGNVFLHVCWKIPRFSEKLWWIRQPVLHWSSKWTANHQTSTHNATALATLMKQATYSVAYLWQHSNCDQKNGQNCQQQSQSSLLLLKILCLHRFIVVQWLNSHHSCGWYAWVPRSVAVVDGVGHGIEGSGYESSNWRCKCWWKDVNRRVELQKIADIGVMWDIVRYCCGKVEESSAPTSPRMKHLCITARKKIGLGSMDSRLSLLGKLNVNNATRNMHWSTHIHSFTATEQETRRNMPCSWLTLKCTSYEVLSNLLNQTEISAEGTSQALWQIPAGGL